MVGICATTLEGLMRNRHVGNVLLDCSSDKNSSDADSSGSRPSESGTGGAVFTRRLRSKRTDDVFVLGVLKALAPGEPLLRKTNLGGGGSSSDSESRGNLSLSTPFDGDTMLLLVGVDGASNGSRRDNGMMIDR